MIDMLYSLGNNWSELSGGSPPEVGILALNEPKILKISFGGQLRLGRVFEILIFVLFKFFLFGTYP